MEITGTNVKELRDQAKALLVGAEALYRDEESGAEEHEKANAMVDDAMQLKARIDRLVMIREASAGLEEVADAQGEDPKGPTGSNGFKSMADFYQAVYAATFKSRHVPQLKTFVDTSEPDHGKVNESGWMEAKDLIEAVGASGGFLVPTEYREELLMWEPDASIVRQRATTIPMRRRAIRIPTLDQTTTTAGQPHWWGGVLAYWTEEATSKTESEPKFRQIELVAHKLVCYTEAGDELLADAAISLEAFLSAAFSGVINWEEEDAFINGTGAGQPLGILNAGVTIAQTRAAANQINLQDCVRMYEQFQGRSPIWMASRNILSNLMLLNGPAANPSYVFMPSARDAMPAYLLGIPLFFSEHCPALGTTGDLILADWSKYLIGDRQAITVDSSKHYRFQYDLTAWRAVKRVDGQPWLSAPLTYQDGTTQVSPFVVLSATES